MRRFPSKALVVLAVVTLALGACGGDDDDDDDSSGSGGDSTEAPAEESGEALKLGFLWEVAGESSFGIDDFQNGAQMAIDEINEAGGFNGQDVTFERVASPVDDPQGTNAAYLEMVDADPDIILGIPALAEAVVPSIESAQIPTVMVGQDAAIYFGKEASSEWLWEIGPTVESPAAAAIDYAINELGAQNIGLMGTDEAYGQTSVAGAQAALEEAGLEPWAIEMYAPDATDLTQQVLAMQGADAVYDGGYPNPVAVQINQLAQNGIDIPTIDATAAAIGVAQGLIDAENFEKVYAVEPCEPAATGISEDLQAFTDAYTERYGATPTFFAATTYEAVKMLVATAEMAGSLEPEALNEALGEVSHDGICGGTMTADGAHVFLHENVVVKYSAEGVPEIVDTIPYDPLPEQSGE